MIACVIRVRDEDHYDVTQQLAERRQTTRDKKGGIFENSPLSFVLLIGLFVKYMSALFLVFIKKEAIYSPS